MPYPTTAFSAATRSAGQTIQGSHVNDLQTELTAVETALLTGGLAHDLDPDATANLRDLGSASKIWRAVYTNSLVIPGPSWTPRIAGTGGSSGNAYSGQIGTYTKVGSLVVAQFTVALSTLGTNPGNVAIDNLPYVASSGNLTATCALQFFGMTGNWITVHAAVQPATFYALLYGMAAAGTSNLGSPLTSADLSNTTDLRGVIVYHTT